MENTKRAACLRLAYAWILVFLSITMHSWEVLQPPTGDLNPCPGWILQSVLQNLLIYKRDFRNSVLAKVWPQTFKVMNETFTARLWGDSFCLGFGPEHIIWTTKLAFWKHCRCQTELEHNPRVSERMWDKHWARELQIPWKSGSVLFRVSWYDLFIHEPNPWSTSTQAVGSISEEDLVDVLASDKTRSCIRKTT